MFKCCNKCEQTLPLDSFGRDKRNKDGKQGVCYVCLAKSNSNRYYQNTEFRESQLAKQASKKKQRKLDAIKYMGEQCADCKQKYHPSVYEFHHLDPKTKDVNLAHFKSASWDKFVVELDKCIMLCANCHRVRHWKEKNEDQ